MCTIRSGPSRNTHDHTSGAFRGTARPPKRTTGAHIVAPDLHCADRQHGRLCARPARPFARRWWPSRNRCWRSGSSFGPPFGLLLCAARGFGCAVIFARPALILVLPAIIWGLLSRFAAEVSIALTITQMFSYSFVPSTRESGAPSPGAMSRVCVRSSCLSRACSAAARLVRPSECDTCPLVRGARFASSRSESRGSQRFSPRSPLT